MTETEQARPETLPGLPIRPAWLPAAGLTTACVVAALTVAAGTATGIWWASFAISLLLGAGARRLAWWQALTVCLLVTVAGWATPLAWLSLHGADIAGVAATVSALTGLPRSAPAGLALGIAVCSLQAASGLAVGRTSATAFRQAIALREKSRQLRPRKHFAESPRSYIYETLPHMICFPAGFDLHAYLVQIGAALVVREISGEQTGSW